MGIAREDKKRRAFRMRSSRQLGLKIVTGLVSDLLDISKIAAGTLTLNFEEVDFKEIVTSSVETLRAQAAAQASPWRVLWKFQRRLAVQFWQTR
jgi:signal transduction histidine kinase